MVTALDVLVGHLLGGAVVVEIVFNWPGIGKLMLVGVLKKDFLVVRGTILFAAVVFVLINLLVDVLYGFLDPRIRYGG